MPAPTTTPDRLRAMQSVELHLAAGLGIKPACLRAGVSRANFYRWKAEEVNRVNGQEVTKGKAGRPPVIELNEAEVRRLRYWRLIRGSVPLALAEFLSDELCRPEVAAFIRKTYGAATLRHVRPSWPLSIRRALYVTNAEKGKLRGDKALDDTVVTERRGDFWRDEDGQDWPLTPCSIYESDDESENEPFRYFDAETGTERLGRQSLKTTSTMSLKWLGFTHLGRERDAYRVEDIAEHFFSIVQDHGLPILWRVERGVWDNNWLFGLPLADGGRWGGLDALFHIRQKHKSRGKANVEGGFNHAQNYRAHGADGGVSSIGRKRGEFEVSSKHYLRAQEGAVESLGRFWSIEQSADATAQALRRFNAEPKQRHIFGGRFISPDEAHGTPAKREVPAAELWRFCPYKNTATVKRGRLEIKVPHYRVSFLFRINGAEGLPGVHLDHGHRLLVAFHPGHPERGCHVFNAEEGAKNREGYGFSELIGMAEHMPDRPQEDLSGTADFSAKRRETASVRREYRGILAGTARETRKSHAQDGLGALLHQQSGGGMMAVKPMIKRGLIIPATVAAEAATPRPAEPGASRRASVDLAAAEASLRGTSLLV